MSISWMDVIAGALKFLVRMFCYRSSVPSEFFFPIACDIWTVLCLYWILSALRIKPVKSRESLGQRLSYVLPLALGLTLLFNPRAHYSWLGMRFAPDTIAVAVAGIVLTAAGVALAMWARLVLGENWSAAVSIRKNQELIRMGPYRIMRHPIYTGMLLGLLDGRRRGRGPQSPGTCHLAAAAATDWSRIDAARPTSVTPKITNGEFVVGSTPQYA